ncbi:glycosyltransferase family A protein [Pelagibacterium montanilacus]|uniref:glycosyltransferase family A protein n=1 Tax=Pelagibacterium montanilacus TaxID=2185280 RepID=UPI000F8EB0F2|nr:glycosyltransferase family A protein [Pelagibacterium montanilacus]
MSDTLISLTTVPKRFETTLPRVLDNLAEQSVVDRVLVNIPHHYRKWGAAHVPPCLEKHPKAHLFRPSIDYGPATKLLGALEYVRGKVGIEYIVTCDDDVLFKSPRHIEHLIRCARMLPDCIVTIGGIRLDHLPFKRKDGLEKGERYTPVHAPQGFRGVVYPAKALMADTRSFSLMHELPSGIFHDDDAYFGIVAGAMGIPVISVPGLSPVVAGGHIGSAVTEGVDEDRITNEANLYSAGVEQGYLTVPAKPYRIGTLARLRMWLSYQQTKITRQR